MLLLKNWAHFLPFIHQKHVSVPIARLPGVHENPPTSPHFRTRHSLSNSCRRFGTQTLDCYHRYLRPKR